MSERDLLLDGAQSGGAPPGAPFGGAPSEDRPEWPIRLWFWVARTWRPELGWAVLALCLSWRTIRSAMGAAWPAGQAGMSAR